MEQIRYRFSHMGDALADHVWIEELASRVSRLEMLLEVSRMMNATANRETLITNIAKQTAEYARADRCSIFFYDTLTDELYTHVATGLEDGQEIRIDPDAGIAGHVFRTGKSLNVPDVTKEPRFLGRTDREIGFTTRSMLSYPIKSRRGKTIGVFQLLNKKTDPGHFDDEDEALLKDLVDQIADLLELVLRKDELAHRNAVLEARMKELSSVEYLIGDRTAINAVFRFNRKLHYWVGLVALVLLCLMSVTSLVMVRSDAWRSLMLGLHSGTAFGLGYRYYIFTDAASIITLVVCLSGLLMYFYPSLNRWLKAKKASIIKDKLKIRGRNSA